MVVSNLSDQVSPPQLLLSELPAAEVTGADVLALPVLPATEDEGVTLGPGAAELLDQHLATLSSAAAPQVISTDRHTVKPWFQGRLPFSFNIPETTALPPDTTLKGADLAYLSGQPAALLLFTIHKHEVSVFLTQRTAGHILSTTPKTREGFNIHTATTPDLNIVAVSDVNPADLDNLMAALLQAQKP